MMFIGYDPIGKTLQQVAIETEPCVNGYSVFVLQGFDDPIGEELCCSWSVGEIIRKFPDVANCKVKFTNDFFGMMVLRVTKENEQ